MNRKLTLAAAALLTLSGVAQAQSPKREMRSTWLTTVWAIDWPASTNQTSAKQQMTNYLDDLAAHNFTGVCFQVRGMADAMYKSSYEPWSSAISGTRGKDPGWDPLAWVVEECHKRGMECYAWVNPYRESSTANPYGTSFDTDWNNKGWLLSNGSYIVFNPGLAEARAHILRVIKEIYTNYAIDGMLFDDYFYPSGGTTESSSAPDYALYKASGTSLSIGDWRRKNVNDFMKEIYDNIQQDRPDMRFGLSPAGVAGASASKYGLTKPPVSASDWQYETIYSDPLAWLAEGAIDFISPQIYWKTTHSTAPFGPLTKWWSSTAEHFGRHFYASHSISLLASDANSQANWADIGQQVTLHRANVKNEAPGELYYSAKNIDGNGNGGVSGLGDYLEENLYTAKSLVPRIQWKEHPTYAAPTGLTSDGTQLTWNAVTGARSNSIIRYTVYAVPTSMSLDDVAAANGDGIDSKYLLGVSYGTSYSLPADVRNDHFYAVCVYDGYGFESEPALLNYSSTPSEPTTLIAPADGSTIADWSVTFKWQAVSDATYSLQVSSNENFTDIVASQRDITANQCTIDLGLLKGSTEFFWRVYTRQPEMQSTASDVFSFITPKKNVGNFEDGYNIVKDPAEYVASANFEIQNLWMRSVREDMDNFPVIELGKNNRGVAATADYIYVSGRSGSSSDATCYLQAYNAATGEHEHDVIISDNARCSYYPCNDVFTDSKGNVCISNLVLNVSTTPLKIHRIDTATGQATEVASLTASSAGRIDHAAVYGDVTSGNFTVFAAVASNKRVYRWKVSDGNAVQDEITVSEFSPASANGFGIAPRVRPVSDDLFYLDGANTQAALYDFSTGKIVDELSDANAAATVTGNGVAAFTLGNDNFLLYSCDSHSGEGYKHALLTSTSDKIMSTGSRLWTLPEGSMGNVNSSTMSSPADVYVVDDNTARLYVYTPGNGLAAYQLTRRTEGVSDVENDHVVAWRMYSNVIVFDEAVDFIKAYNLAGMEVASAASASELALPSAGNYIVVTPNGAFKVSVNQ